MIVQGTNVSIKSSLLSPSRVYGGEESVLRWSMLSPVSLS